MNYQLSEIDRRFVVLGVIVALVLTISGSGVAYATQSDVGDIRVSLTYNDSYSGEVNLYNVDGQLVADTTVESQPVVFKDVEYGQYRVESTYTDDFLGVRATSDRFSHEADTTLVEWDAPSDDLTVSEENQFIEYVALTPQNTADFVQNPSLSILLGMLITGSVLFMLTGAVVLVGLRIVRSAR